MTQFYIVFNFIACFPRIFRILLILWVFLKRAENEVPLASLLLQTEELLTPAKRRLPAQLEMPSVQPVFTLKGHKGFNTT